MWQNIQFTEEEELCLECARAEMCCEAAQRRIEQWMADHPHQDVPGDLLQQWHVADQERQEADAALAAWDKQHGH